MVSERREPLRVLVFSASLRVASLNTRRAWVEFLGEHPDPAVDRVEH